MDTTGTLDLLNCKVFTLLTNSYAGGMTVAVVITTVESEEAISTALRMIKEMTDNKFAPKIFMTDNSAAERAAIRSVFAKSLLLLCQFHVLQALWRHIWKNESRIDYNDRQDLFFSFKRLLQEKNEEDFVSKKKNISCRVQLSKSIPLLYIT